METTESLIKQAEIDWMNHMSALSRMLILKAKYLSKGEVAAVKAQHDAILGRAEQAVHERARFENTMRSKETQTDVQINDDQQPDRPVVELKG